MRDTHRVEGAAWYDGGLDAREERRKSAANAGA